MNDNFYKNLEEEGESYRDSYRESYHTIERANATAKANAGWFQKFNPRNFARNYAMWILICIFIIVILFIIYWRYIRPKWCKKFIKNYHNLKGSNTLILHKVKLQKLLKAKMRMLPRMLPHN